MQKIPVYFVPGLASSKLIFEYIKLPDDKFEVVIMDWILPERGESLREYSLRLAKKYITHDNPVLIGVSMGGLVVQEMCKAVKAQKVIIISSVKSNREFPRRMRFAKKTKIYRLFPTRMMQNVEKVNRFFPGNNMVKRRLQLYEKFLGFRNKKYLDWSFEKIIEWDRAEPDPDVIHIHGTNDGVFPAKYINNYIPVKNGTHIMIINRFSWLNERLPGIITGETDIEKLKIKKL
jgi:pimeloyl-ACP methyl ester carboxylesterase